MNFLHSNSIGNQTRPARSPKNSNHAMVTKTFEFSWPINRMVRSTCRTMERAEPISDVHSHMRALNLCHLAGISARLGRKVQWDADKQAIEGDEQANAMLARPYRKGFEIQM